MASRQAGRPPCVRQPPPLHAGRTAHTRHAARRRADRPLHARRGPITWRSSLKNTIYDVLKARPGWVETESEAGWDFFWADKGCVRARLHVVCSSSMTMPLAAAAACSQNAGSTAACAHHVRINLALTECSCSA